ncbi:efflux transporter [Companilactobacillus mindensis DSM 14500]|uniref:Efflux transporter n=1 Tax=Companilactobacillus mindensis DSM 14500 TaxID=1423770 RepID=A0A0R1QJ32_9LACO|nr:MFS transporter [Companilactobacillus mindensis]KRL42756.1 efflux transporter [Companilactobacillus mindensis DSM 14500]GEO79073.1 putative MFS-type transporter YttB [Companilactobacillus mindensis]
MQKVTAKTLILGAFLESVGASFIWPINTIFIHNYLHKSLAVAGMVLFFNSLLTFMGNYAGGKMFDRIGGHKTVIFSTSIALLALVGLIFDHGWPAYPILLPILGFGVGSAFTVINSFAAQIDEVDKYKLFNAIYVGTNLGNAIGTALGGYIAGIQMTLVFVANFIFLSLFFILVIFWYNNRNNDHKQRDNKIKIKRTKLQPGIGLIALFLGMTWVSYSQWSSNISAHLTELGILVSKYSLLWTINAIVIVVFLPLINHLGENQAWFKKIQIPLGVFFFITAFASLIGAKSYLVFALGMVVLTLGEMLVYPGIPAMVSEATPKSEAGRYQSLLSMSSTFARAIGPMLGGMLIEHSSYNVMYIAAIVVLVLSLLLLKRGRKELVEINE